MSKGAKKVSVNFGTDSTVVTVHVSGTSEPIICGLLGVDVDEQGIPQTLYLDSLIHRLSDIGNTESWGMSGAISTVLTRLKEQKQS